MPYRVAISHASCWFRLLCCLMLGEAIVFGQTTTSVTVSASPNPARYGQPVTIQGTVTSGATGKVTFYDGVTVLGVGTISGNTANLTTILLASGTRSLRAYYSGDSTHAAASSTPVAEVVTAGPSLGFRPAVAYTTGTSYSVAVGDFNADGKADLAVANNSSSNVSVLLGNGDGTFQAAVNYATGPIPRSVVVGDFNGDGKTDLAVANNSSSTVSVLLGNGDGTFRAAVNYAVASGPSSLAAGDFNNDGISDLAVVNTGSSSVGVLLGNGDGTFRAAVNYIGFNTPESVAVGDFNGDGKADLVVGGYATLSLMLGNGDGTFQNPVAVPSAANYYVYGVTVADFNGDGKVDLAVGSSFSYMSVLLGKGDGTFQAPVNYSTSSYAAGMVSGDFNGDGIVDLAVTISGVGLSVLLGNGDGTFQRAINYTASSPWGLAVGDFNGDNIADLAIALNGTSAVGVQLGGALPDLSISENHGNGFTQGQAGAYAITVTNGGVAATTGAVGVVASLPSGFTASAISGSGWTCVLTSLTCTRSDSLAIGASYSVITIAVNVPQALTGNVTATATVSGGGDQSAGNNTASDTAFVRLLTSIAISASPNPAVVDRAVTLTATVGAGATGTVTFYDGVTVLGVAPLSGGHATLVAYTLAGGTHFLRGVYSGDGTYGIAGSNVLSETVTQVASNGFQSPIGYTVTGVGQIMGVADFNHDGKLDVVAVSGNTLSVLLGNGGGAFRGPFSYPASNANSLAISDFNGDGNPDVVIANGNTISVLLGNGDGTFRAPLAMTGVPGASLVSADFNGDGKPDLAVINLGAPNILFGNGDGTFQAPKTLANGGVTWSYLLVADFNGDGKADLAGLNIGYVGSVGVFLGAGDGTFQGPVGYTDPSISFAETFAVGDFNGDGKPDVAVIYLGSVTVLAGVGDGTLHGVTISPLGNAPGAFSVAGDFNGDGRLDFAFNGFGGFCLMFGNGDGSFQPCSLVPTNGSPAGIVTGDFNGDGRLDLAASNPASGAINIYLGVQSSGLSIAVTHTGNITGGASGTYQILVANPGLLPSSGSVSVTIALPAGLAATSLSGNLWNCVLSALTCTRTDALGGLSSYTPISMTVAASLSAAPSTVTVQATVANGSIVNTAANPTNIVAPTTTALVVSPNPSVLGQAVTLTATITGASGAVEFFDNGSFLGSAILSNSQATLTTRLLPAGVRSEKAAYSGDSAHAASVSAIVTETVNAAAASGLMTATSYATGIGPLAVASGDFNGDGKIDLVTANGTANTVSVLLGNGDGTFRPGVDYYTAGINPSAVAVGDFNNDGKIDLAVTNQISGSAIILLGNGDGTFQLAVSLAAGASPLALAAGDFNNDGNADLVIGGSLGWRVLFGNGDGTFSAGSTASAIALRLALGDFNNDGKTDLAYAGNGPLSVVLGNGDGTFSATANSWNNFAYGNSPFATGDLNGDGKLDIVEVSSSNRVTVYLGRGDGTTSSSASYSTGATPNAVILADVNGDGKLDVVTANSNNTISVLQGNGDGSLQAPVFYSAGANPAALAAGDFNGDGRTDLAVANSSSNNVSVLLGVLTPVLSVASSHNGAFAPGQTGAVYTLSVINQGPGATSGAVTVTDTLPAGLTATGLSGTGWSCTLATLTCTRSDALSASASYPVIILTVSVSPTAPSSVNNSVAVTGGSAIGGSATDFTVITSTPAVLTISKTHSGNFAQGQNGAAYAITVSNAAGAGASVGPVSVTETVPAGLTLVSMSGAGWSCSSNVCTRSDALNGGAAYPPIAVTVNVAANAPAQATNQVSLSGGGSATAGASDATNITNCTYSVNPPNAGAAPTATSGSVVVTTAVGCPWSATSGATWLSIASGSSATGGGTLNYNVAANTTGAQRSGTLTVAGQTVTVTQGANNPLQIPALVSLNPFQGTGPNATLTLVYSHPSGWAAIQSAEFIVNPRWESQNRTGGCYIKYTPATSLFSLIADDGSGVAGAAAPGSTTTLSNSQCSLNAAASTATGSGTTLTVVAALTFSASFTGQRHIWMQASDYNNLSTNWLVYGAWFPTTTKVSTVNWYQVYDPNSKTYLYTSDPNEYATLGSRGFVQQGILGLVMDSPTTVAGASNIIWYRVFVNANSSHFYTSDRNEFLTLVNQQQAYVGEGVQAFVMPYLNAQGQVSPPVTNSIPFYRAAQGAALHYWTTDSNPAHVPQGYTMEGIASYIFPASGAQGLGMAMPEHSPVVMPEGDGTPAVVSVSSGRSAIATGVVAPGQLLTIHGWRLGGRVLLNGVPVPVVSAEKNELQVVVPADLTGSEAKMEIEYEGRPIGAMKLAKVSANPTILGTNRFGRGNADAQNEDGTANDAEHPARRGSIVTLYTTGFAADSNDKLEVHVGGRPAEVISVDPSETRPGIVEVRIRVPDLQPAPFEPVVLHVGNQFSGPGLGLAIR